MSFLFATSHLPAVKRPQVEEEDEDNAQPMQRSGGVRAISHLEEPGREGPSVPLSQRGAQPLGRLVQAEKPAGAGSAPADGVAAAKASGIFDVVRHQYNLGGNDHYIDEHGQLQRRKLALPLPAPSPGRVRIPSGGVAPYPGDYHPSPAPWHPSPGGVRPYLGNGHPSPEDFLVHPDDEPAHHPMPFHPTPDDIPHHPGELHPDWPTSPNDPNHQPDGNGGHNPRPRPLIDLDAWLNEKLRNPGFKPYYPLAPKDTESWHYPKPSTPDVTPYKPQIPDDTIPWHIPSPPTPGGSPQLPHFDPGAPGHAPGAQWTHNPSERSLPGLPGEIPAKWGADHYPPPGSGDTRPIGLSPRPKNNRLPPSWQDLRTPGTPSQRRPQDVPYENRHVPSSQDTTKWQPRRFD